MSVWRLHLRATGGAGDPDAGFPLCEKQQIVGMGWAVTWPDSTRKSWENYAKLGSSEYGDHSWRVNTARFATEVNENDLIWTRNKGMYFLARVSGSWSYRDRAENRDADIVNVRPVEMINVGDVSDVPGKVVACFRPSLTFQRIADPTVAEYSKFLFNKLARRPVFQTKKGGYDIFSLLDDQDCEDLVWVYLQIRGFVVFPARRRYDTPTYEYVARHRKDGRKALAQVKTGNTTLNVEDGWPKDYTVFLFSPNENYYGKCPANVIALRRDEILSFMKANRELLPTAISTWMDIADDV
jgi:hypothetical protein